MNALTNTSPEYRHTRDKDRSTPRLDRLTAKVTAAPAANGNGKRSRAVDGRLSSLKVLAVTLLNEIEALENCADEVSELNLQAEVRRFEAELIRNALVRTGGKQRQFLSGRGLWFVTARAARRSPGLSGGLCAPRRKTQPGRQEDPVAS